MSSIWTFRFSCFLLICVLLLILAGGLVTSKEAGLAVPDWPLSYGQFFPPMVGNVFWEHGHRMIAGCVGILTFFLAIALQFTEDRSWLKKLGWIAFGTVVLQALLGGLTVLLLLPPAVSIFHACLAQTFFCLIVAITYFLSPYYKTEGAIHELPLPLRSLKRIMTATVMTIYIQLILGAVVRHTGHAIAFHVIFAFVVITHITFVSLRILNLNEERFKIPMLPSMRRGALSLGLLGMVQIFLGFGAFVFTRMVERGYAPSFGEVFFTAAHQTTGAAILALSVFLSLLVWR